MEKEDCYAADKWPNEIDESNRICSDCDTSCTYTCIGFSNLNCTKCDINS